MKILRVLILCLFTTPVFATDVWFTSEIKEIYPTSQGTVILVFKSNSTRCTRDNKYHYIQVGKNGVNHEGLNAMLSVALTAATLGKPIAINFDSSSNICAINRFKLIF